ncbi:hypothetical protein ACTGVV_12205, partial [Streptococcus suis]
MTKPMLLADFQRLPPSLRATVADGLATAIDAVAGRAGIDIFMLHPSGRVSDVQRRQMTTVLAP